MMKLYTRDEVERVAREAARRAADDLRNEPENMCEGYEDAFDYHLRLELNHEETIAALEESIAARALQTDGSACA